MIRWQPILIALIVYATSGVGCASHKPAKHHGIGGETIPEELSPFQILSTSPAQGVVTAKDIYPMQVGERRLRVIEGEITSGDESSSTQVLSATTELRAQFTKAEDHARTEYLSVDAQGNVVMNAVIETKDNALSLFDPPMAIAFAELKPGEERRVESKMRVVDVKSRTHERESGKAVRTITYKSDQRIRTPLGDFDAKRVEVHFVATLKLANADEQSTLWIVPGMGIVAEQTTEEIKVLGLAGRKSTRTLLLVTEGAMTRPLKTITPASQPVPF